MGSMFPNITMNSRTTMMLRKGEKSIEVRGRAPRFLRVVQEGGLTNSLMREPLREWEIRAVFGRARACF